ncbi:MAG: flippase [Bryobacteraceae bacterium]|jgi:PST family polysaccharide transporter
MISALIKKIDGRRIAGSRMAQNVAALYGVQFGRKVIPLISVPYLARVLGPVGWGKVAFVTAVAEFLVILIEFGFNLSATREVARNRDCPEKCGEVMAGVLGAQALLSVLGVALALTIARWIPLLRENPTLLMGGMVYGVCQGFAPVWFFQGLERLRLSSGLEIGGKTAALFGLFVFVHSPADGWKVMALAGIAPAVTTLAALLLAYRTIPLRSPSPALVRRAILMGWPMFVFRSAESLYGVGNSFLLGLFAGPVVVGYFAAAEKISKAAFGLLIPIRDAVYPRLSHLAKQGRDAAAPLARLGAMAMIGGGLALSTGLFVAAPWLTRLLLGAAFQPAVAVLRILSALPLLLSITNSVGVQWLLPFGKDAAINQIIIAAGLLNVALSVALAPRFAHIGMAWAVVLSEAFVCASLTLAALRTTPGPAPVCLAAET